MGRKDVKIIRSNRRTISLEITPTGEVLVRAPRHMSEAEIRAFVESKSSWLAKHLQKKEKDMESLQEEGRFTEDFHCIPKDDDIYFSVRLEDMDELNNAAGLTRVQVVAADGAANYVRPYLNKLDEEGFKHFIEYHLATCERMDMMGATAHTIDILRK